MCILTTTKLVCIFVCDVLCWCTWPPWMEAKVPCNDVMMM